MGTLIRPLVLKFLPARLAWIVGAFILARVLTGRRERSAGPGREPATKVW
jgi:hypothetical protein